MSRLRVHGNQLKKKKKEEEKTKIHGKECRYTVGEEKKRGRKNEQQIDNEIRANGATKSLQIKIIS